MYTPLDRALMGVSNELRNDMVLTTWAINRIITFLKGDAQQVVVPAPLIAALQKNHKLQSALEQFADRAAKENLGRVCEERAHEALSQVVQ